jgi:peptidoglycan hydrolase-like protein with peptidoglycan-binding domain
VADARFAGTAVLAGLTLLGAAGATGFLLRPAPAPEQLRSAGQLSDAPVGHERLADERTVKISLTRAPAAPLTVGLAGRVTEVSCRPGRPLASGQRVARIDGVPVVALATREPPYRDLTRGDKGGDVRAVQRELRRLGYAAPDNGRYDRRTSAAVRKLQKAAGKAAPDGKLAAAEVLWLPAASVRPGSCEQVLGARIAAGQQFAKVPARLTAVTVDALPGNLVAGPRTLTVMGATGPLGREGAATDVTFLGRVAASAEYRLLESSGKDADVTGSVALREPLDTLKMPPGAIFGLAGDTGCVRSGGQTYPVRVVSSRLGATLVTVEGPAPQRVDLGPSVATGGCE